MNLKLKVELYYSEETWDINYRETIFTIVDRRWFNFLAFMNGAFIYCDDVMCFATQEARTHFLWVLKLKYPSIQIKDKSYEELKAIHI